MQIMERRSLLVRHIPLEATLPADACSPASFHPRAVPFSSYYNKKGYGGSPPCSPCPCPFLQPHHCPLSSAFYLSYKGVWRPRPHVHPCPFYPISFLTCKGVWGAAPCQPIALDLWPLTFPLLKSPQKNRACALSFALKNPVPSERSPVSRSPCARRAGWRPGCRG